MTAFHTQQLAERGSVLTPCSACEVPVVRGKPSPVQSIFKIEPLFVNSYPDCIWKDTRESVFDFVLETTRSRLKTSQGFSIL